MRILEAGHYYLAKGPTLWSVVGWEIMKGMCSGSDKSMLFIDDVHNLDDVSADEAELPVVAASFNSEADFVILESQVKDKARDMLRILMSLPKKRRPRLRGRIWYCSGFALNYDTGTYACTLFDAGLTLFKSQLGFREGVNILPKFYEEQQTKLLRLVQKALPDFRLRVVLYDLDGKSWELEHKA